MIRNLIARFFVFAVIGCITINNVKAQRNLIDSLVEITNASVPDTVKLKAYCLLLEQPLKDSSINYINLFNQAIILASKVNGKSYEAELYNKLGSQLRKHNKSNESLVAYQKSLEIAEVSDLLNEKADAYDRIAATYKSMRNFEKAEEYLSKYIETYKLIQKNNQQKETDFLEVAYELDRQEAIRLQAKRENKLQNKVVREQNRGKLIVIAFLVILGGILVWELFKVVRERNLKHKGLSSFLVQQAAPHMLEVASQWNRMEEFLANKRTSVNQELQWKATHRMREIKIHSNLYLIIETNASQLEEFVLCDFLKDNIHESMDETTIHKLISSQNLIDVDQVSFGFIQISDEVVSVMGDHLLISQGEGEVLFPSSTYKKLNRFDVVITDRLRNYLIEKNSWEMWVEQLKQIRNMSSSMAFQTLEDAWILDFNEGKFGLIFKT
jgi:tetratricopeptide (TPR) repeat protein